MLLYEREALIPPRSELNDSPRYTEQDILRMRFAKRAQALGFTFDEIRELLVVRAELLGEGEDLVDRIPRWTARIEDRVDMLRHLKSKLESLAARTSTGGARAQNLSEL